MGSWVNKQASEFKAFSIIAIGTREVELILEGFERDDMQVALPNLQLFRSKAIAIQEQEHSEHSPEFIAKGVNSVAFKEASRPFLQNAIADLAEKQDPQLGAALLNLRKLDGDLELSIEQSLKRSCQDTDSLNK